MSVSVVIPTTLSRDVVQRSVESVVRSAEQVPGAEVILVVNGHAGRHKPRIDSPVLHVVETDLLGSSNARNIGFEQAHHDATLCTDDDCVVPEGWCAELLRALQGDAAAVAAPVDVEVRGPVTGFLDYQRLFDAPPLPPENFARFPVMANCGVRRDLLPADVSFEPTLTAAGEDTEYGLRVRDAGHNWHWCEPRVLHLIPEDVSQITDRWQRYGAGSAQLFLRFGRWQTSYPGAIDSYRRLARGILAHQREFSELADQRLRRTFAVLDLILACSWLPGYLAAAGDELGIQLVALDAEALSEALREAAEPALAAAPASPSAWRDPLIDPRGLADGLAEPVPLPAAEVAAALRRHAAIVDDARVADAEPVLDRWADRYRERTEAAISRVQDAADELQAMQQPGVEDVRRVLRGHSLPFGSGMLGIELMASTTGLTPPWFDRGRDHEPRTKNRVATRGTAAERLLVNFFYAHPVGHAVEALHYCLGYHAADPDREIALALNAETATRLADFCPFVSSVYVIDHPFATGRIDSRSRLAGVPRRWDWVVDDARRGQELQLRLFRGMRDYYAASDEHLIATRGRTFAGGSPPAYLRHQQLRLELPDAARGTALTRMADGDGAPWIAIMPAGSGERALYPSVASWRAVLDALHEAVPTARLALVGKLHGRNRPSLSTLGADEVRALLTHPAEPLDCFDDDLAEQLAIVEAADLFLSPHTGFGFAALAVATPWLTISGGRWFEWFFNRVPFRSVIPDTERYPCFSQFGKLPVVDDGDDGPRTPSMTRARILDDLDAIVDAAIELIDGRVIYEEALTDYFQALLQAHRGDSSAIGAIDDVHTDYVGK